MTQLARGPRCYALPDYNTFRTFGDFYDFLDAHRMTLFDMARTIQRACSLQEGGATKEEMVRYVRMIHGIPPEEAGWIEFVAALLASRGKIARARGRYSAPPPTQRVLALVEYDEDDAGLFEKYVYRGTAAFIAGGD
jgi:hypothetical protein